MSCRLFLAVLASLLLHGGLLFPDILAPAAPPARRLLEASLQMPNKPRAVADEPLLKNTLAAEKPPPALKQAPLRSPPDGHLAPATPKRVVEAAQRKLAQHLYYPPEAVSRGIEGEVRLLLRVADDGSIVEVSVAAGSGHALLDQAAVRAVWAMGRVSWAPSRELILPVIFRLD